MKKTLFVILAAAAVLGCGTAKNAADKQANESPVNQGVERTTYIYAIKGVDTLKLDIYIDKGIKAEGKRPVMIYVHGGGYSAGSRKNVAQEIYNRHYASKGYISASIDYRLGMADPVKYGITSVYHVAKISNEDLIDATNFILGLSELNPDPEKVIIGGGSAGACTCLTIENDICNGVEYTKKLPEGFNYAGIVSQAGGVVSDKQDIHWDNKPCPVFLLHGDQDLAVADVNQSQEASWFTCVASATLHKQFTEMGVPHWYYVNKGADHVMAMITLTDYLDETDKFIEEFVNKKSNRVLVTERRDKIPANMAGVDSMLKYVPLYILGFGKYSEEMEAEFKSGQMDKPSDIVY